MQARKNAEEEKKRFDMMVKDVRKELETRKKALDEREKKILGAESQNHSFLTQCLRVVKREEGKQLRENGSTTRIQSRLQSTFSQLGRTQTELENTRRELEREWCVNNRGSFVQAEEGHAVENRPECEQPVTPVTRRYVDVIGIDESSASGDESSHGQQALREEGNERVCRRIPQFSGAKRMRRNYRIE